MQHVKLYQVVVIVLVVVVLVLGMKLKQANTTITTYQNSQTITDQHVKIIAFGGQFVDKVLQADSEVSVEDRLQLENDVRDLSDDEILLSWQRFSNSTDQTEAQQEVKNLLSLFFQRLQ